MDRYRQSLAMLKHARLVTPGAAQTLSRRPERFTEGAYPVFLESGLGAQCWDIDENEYVDWIMGLAAMTLGYAHPEVTEAVVKQAREGVTFSLPHRLEVEVADRLCEIIPCAESVRFVKTGSEADSAAVRIARIATGRELILKCGYTGWHDWAISQEAFAPGIPQGVIVSVRSFSYNNLNIVTDHFKLYGDDIAAVILEPVILDPPAKGFLEGLRELCHAFGSLLIFDEVVSGFRWARAGAQEYFGVMPDLATFGKAMANGYPLACVVGRRDLMQHAWPISGTFGGEAVSLAACRAVLDIYDREPIIDRLWMTGCQFIAGIEEWAARLKIPLRIRGYPVHPKIEFGYERESVEMTTPYKDKREWVAHAESAALMALLLQETAARGVLFHPGGCNPSAAHTTDDIRHTIAAFREAFAHVAEALADGTITKRLKGQPCQESAFRRTS